MLKCVNQTLCSHLLRLFLVSIAVAGFFLFAANYRTESGGYLFVMYADALAHGASYLNANVVSRDIGYPFLLYLSGYPYHHSLIGIALMNTIMAIFIPVLIYLTVKPVLPKGAYTIALASIISLAPFYYIKWIHHDHAYIFFNILSLCCLSLFIDTKRFIYLFAMTLAVIMASLIRPAGNILFPFFILMAFMFGRGNIFKYFICILIALSVFWLYSLHRHHFFSRYAPSDTTIGGQTFQNLYVNSKEFGIRLSRDLGRGMQTVSDNLYQAVLPHPSVSAGIKPKDERERAFFNTYISTKSPQAFMDQVYEYPSIEFYQMLYHATSNDALFLKASFEIMQHYPWYPLAFTLRNMWYLLYRPGYTHVRYSLAPMKRLASQTAFPFDYESDELEHLSARALRELAFDTFAHKPAIVKKSVKVIRFVFRSLYFYATKVLFYLMLVAWFALIVRLLSRFSPSDKFKQWMNLFLPKKMNALIIILSLYLLLCMLIISVFVDPLLRFHNHLILFKIMLAGLGFAILIRMRRLLFSLPLADLEQAPSQSEQLLFGPHAMILASLVISLLAAWSIYIIVHT